MSATPKNIFTGNAMNLVSTFFSLRNLMLLSALLCMFSIATLAQSTSAVQGTVTDQGGAVVANAKVSVTNVGTGLERTTQTDANGYYSVTALPIGKYSVQIDAPGLQKQLVKDVDVNVASTSAVNVQLKVSGSSEVLTVTSEAPVIESTTQTVGTVINQKTVQEIPLNGRHFVDLGLLIPGSVTPPQNGFLSAPLRGQGSFAFNTAGQREDTVNFLVNGVNLQDPVQNQITFQPSINTVSEFKVDNSTYSAESGKASGAIVNIATRSGSNDFHGEGFEFIRNNAFDARNFFNPTSKPQDSFKRNQFGGNIGGPVFRNKAFFFGSYEGLRQRQGININSTVLSSAQRTQATTIANPAVLKLLPLIPVANDASGLKFISSATAPVNIDQGTGDVSYSLSDTDRIHGYYAWQRDQRGEPTLQGNSISGFGDTRRSHRQIFTLGETHVFSPTVVNDVRFGFNRINITFTPNNLLNAADFNINDGVNAPIGLPEINLADIRLDFGGPSGFPQGRGDLTAVLNDTLNYTRGKHSWKFGGEFRRESNNAFNSDTGFASFNTTTNFINGTVDNFQITPGSRPSRIYASALGIFAQDSWKVSSRLTAELGLRYDWNGTPVEAKNRFVVFDAPSRSLIQVGTNGVDRVYGQNARNFQPRVGFAYDVFGGGKTLLRAGYGLQTDQPVLNLVGGLPSNPPFAIPVNVNSVPLTAPNPAGVVPTSTSPATVNRNFKNAYVQSWNLNIQQEITPTIGMMIGYFGSKGTHLRLPHNLNQLQTLGVGASRPITALSATSPILPGVGLTNIVEQESVGNSNYNALWVTANKRFNRGVQFNASYTWSKSLDYNSLSSQGFGARGSGTTLQDSNNPRGDYAPSDFDARHRFVINGIYDLPFKGNRVIEGWQFSTIVQLQTGNPIDVVNPSAAITGAGNSVRPDLIAPVSTGFTPVANGNVQYLSGSACNAAAAGCSFLIVGNRFGNLARNAIVGSGFENIDFSIVKKTKITERVSNELRLEAFDLFNHPNFGQPNRLLSAANGNTFGQISNTRFPTGDSGSSRQLQFAIKLVF